MFEVKCALGILIISRFHKLVNSRSYSEKQPFMPFLHDTDSIDLPKGAKVGQVSKYLDEIRSNFKTYCICERVLDIDRYMVGYFGRYGTFFTVCQQKRKLPILPTFV